MHAGIEVNPCYQKGSHVWNLQAIILQHSFTLFKNKSISITMIDYSCQTSIDPFQAMQVKYKIKWKIS